MNFPVELLAQNIVSGLLMGFVYAVVAVGPTLIFGMMRLVNFAHGEFLMFIMYFAFWAWRLLGIDPMVMLPVNILVGFVLGSLVYKGIIAKILHAPAISQMFAAFGLMVFLRSSAHFLWTPNFRMIQDPWASGRLEILGVYVGVSKVVAGVGAGIAFALLHWLLTRTDLGRAMRATAQDRQAASLMGIDTERVYMVTWGISGALVGVAGTLLSNFFFVYPEVGFFFTTIAFVVVALGGFGSVAGAFVAALVVGVVEGLGGLLFPPGFKYVVVYGMFLVVVLARPRGLFGRH